MKLGNLSPSKGSVSKTKRIGRGNATGQGRTAGKGHNGYKSRSGAKARLHFEGGQTPLARRLPKIGMGTGKFNHLRTKKSIQVLNLTDLSKLKEKDITALSQLEHVTCKLSGLMAYCAPGTSSYETIKPYVDHVLDSFGPNRIVWGSDWPVVDLGKGLPEWLIVTSKILSNLSSDESSKIANINAKRIYKI